MIRESEKTTSEIITRLFSKIAAARSVTDAADHLSEWDYDHETLSGLFSAIKHLSDDCCSLVQELDAITASQGGRKA